MRTRLFPLWAVLALVPCIFATSPQFASAARHKGIDPALLAKANAGDAAAQYQLGNAYNYAEKVRRDYAQALFWYRKGAEQDNADSEFQLGGLYHLGRGVPQDNAKAFAWTMKAAKQGHTDAEFFISTCYTEGWGVAKDEAQGMLWLRKAAEQGHYNSQYQLGWAYEDGINVPQDYSRAYFWLDLAALEADTRGDRKKARKRRDKASSHVTPSEQARVQKRVQAWLQDHPAKVE